METRITVVDGCDGLTPDMLRMNPNWRRGRRWMFKESAFPPEVADDFKRRGMQPWYFQDPMHD